MRITPDPADAFREVPKPAPRSRTVQAISDFFFGPFERLIRPLDLPIDAIPDRGAAALVAHFAWKVKGVLAAVAAFSIVGALINLAVVWGLAFVVDGLTQQGPAAFVEAYGRELILVAVLFVIIEPTIYFGSRALNQQAFSVALPAAIRWQGHKAVERMDYAFFHDTFSGQVASRINQLVGAVQRELGILIDRIPSFAFQFAGSAGLLAVLSWPLAIPVVFWIAANVALAWLALPVFLERSKFAARASSRAVGVMADVYSNIQTVKLYAAEDSEAGTIRDTINENVETQHALNRSFLSTEFLVHASNVALWVAIAVTGFVGLARGFVSVGDFVAAATVARMLSSNAMAFLGIGQGVARALGTIRDAMPVMTTPPKVVDVPDARDLKVTQGAIAFEDVGFFYHRELPVIEHLTLDVKPGEKIGLVGVSGAGKTTLASLLLRLYDVTGGSILIDGQDISRVTQSSLRSQISVITQDTALLHRSIGDNIRYGRPGASDAEIETVAKLALADGFIADLKDANGRRAYDAFVGDRGIKLSGGQRQRIAIARALLKDAPILLLDEATSSLDSEAEAAIQQNLETLMKDKTVLCIAHRLSTIASMDRIVVLDRGRIVEEGTAEELRLRGGLFARLWALQRNGLIGDELAEQPAA